MANIHPTAIIEPGAQLAESVTVGPYTIIRANVSIGKGTTVGPHCVIEGHTTIGRDNRIFQFVSLGSVPQDVPPFAMVSGNPAEARSFNLEGLKRRGFSTERIAAIKQMHKLLYRQGLTLDDARKAIEALAQATPEAAEDVALMSNFLAESK